MDRFLALFVTASIFFTACGGIGSQADSVPTGTVQPPTQTLQPSQTPNPGPSPTQVISATHTSSPTATEEPFPPPTPDPRPHVALTIDDGWSKGGFDAMLDLLSEHDVRATFFFIAVAADRLGPERMQRLVGDGHEIAYHSYSHGLLEVLRSWGVAEWSEDYERWVESMRQILGEVSYNEAVRSYARPPYGLRSTGFFLMTEQKDLALFDWSIDTQMLARGYPLSNGDILLLHVSLTDVQALTDILMREDIYVGPLSDIAFWVDEEWTPVGH